MLYRVRTTIKDRPGVLAALARSCGDAGINILSLQVFPAHDGVTDELVVSVGAGTTEVVVHDLVVEAGGEHVTVTRCTARSLHDAPTSYLQAAGRVARGTTRLVDELARRLEPDPPDVGSYRGHDRIVVGDAVVARAVPFTAAERARAEALGELLGATTTTSTPPGGTRTASAGASAAPTAAPAATPAATSPTLLRAPVEAPHVRAATPNDTDALAAMHTRCSETTLYRRYHAPMSGVIHRRMARRLAGPVGGTALVAERDRLLVGHAMVVPTDDETPQTWELGLVVEDAWQRRGIGTALIRRAARVAREEGADEVMLVTQPGNDAILRTIGRAGFLARITRVDNTVRIIVDVRVC